jgi:ligand-binding sensor domain-containing protein
MPVEPGGFRFFTKKNGLAGNWIRDIAEDAAGNLWIATTDGGISRLKIVGANPDNPVFKTFSLAEGLPSESIHALHFDKTGRLWFASQSGYSTRKKSACWVRQTACQAAPCAA